MFVTLNSNSPYSSPTEKGANRSTEMFVLNENQPRENGNTGQREAAADSEMSFSAKLASMFLVPERPEAEASTESTSEDSLSIYEKQFLELADKTLAERIRDQYLKDHDLTEDDVNAMSPEDREALEKEIGEAILEAMGVNEEQQTIAITINVPAATDTVAADAKDETTQL